MDNFGLFQVERACGGEAGAKEGPENCGQQYSQVWERTEIPFLISQETRWLRSDTRTPIGFIIRSLFCHCFCYCYPHPPFSPHHDFCCFLGSAATWLLLSTFSLALSQLLCHSMGFVSLYLESKHPKRTQSIFNELIYHSICFSYPI